MRRSGKLLSLLLAVLMLTALMPLSALAAELPFTDVPQDAWYYPVVREAYEKGITNGVTRTTFEPNATVTREMFLVMLYRAADIKLDIFHTMFSKWEEEVIQKSYFSDVKKDTWYAETVCLAKEMDVAYGVEGVRFEGDEAVAQARFGVGEPITREQMATFAARFMDVRKHVALKDAENPVKAFSDADQISDWAKDAAEAMRVSGVMQGDAQQRLHPKDLATRAEAAAVVLRLAAATERVSFVPEGTAWIQLKNAYDLPNGEPRHRDIKDPQAVQDMIRYLDNMPIAAEYGMPGMGGWTFWISFYDQNDQYLGGYEYDPTGIEVGHSALLTGLPYFLPWTLMS